MKKPMKSYTYEQVAEIEAALKENIELREKNMQYQKRIAEYEADTEALKDVIISFLEIIGIARHRKIKAELLLPESHPDYRNPMKHILSAITGFATLAGQAKILPGKMGQAAEAELMQKFSFIKKHIHLIEKYGY
jgi:hypothetical protein